VRAVSWFGVAGWRRGRGRAGLVSGGGAFGWSGLAGLSAAFACLTALFACLTALFGCLTAFGGLTAFGWRIGRRWAFGRFGPAVVCAAFAQLSLIGGRGVRGLLGVVRPRSLD
jgi:hypothetical protein